MNTYIGCIYKKYQSCVRYIHSKNVTLTVFKGIILNMFMQKMRQKISSANGGHVVQAVGLHLY